MAKLKIAQYFGDKLNSGMYDNGVWMNLLDIPFLQYIDEAKNYDIVIRTLWMEATVNGWSQEIRKRFPAVKQIGLSDHPLSTHISKMPAAHQLRYLRDLTYLDGIMALTDEEQEWYQTAVPSIPVMKMGLPFPFESYEEKYGSLRDSEKKYIGLGVGASDNDRNFISSWIVFNKLKLFYPELIGVFLSIPDPLIGDVSQLADGAKDIYIQQRQDMGEYYDTLSQCKFVISLADRNTPGRLQGEAAFFGVPVIGSNRLELQNELFPDLAIKPYELDKAYQLAELLLEEGFPQSKKDKALEGLRHYSYRASKRRFNHLLKVIMEE